MSTASWVLEDLREVAVWANIFGIFHLLFNLLSRLLLFCRRWLALQLLSRVLVASLQARLS